jgi:PAS domain S-box-containing protein
MAAKSGSGKKSGSTHRKVDAEDKDRLISELKDRLAILENEPRLKREDARPTDDAEHKLMETALEQSEQRLINILESIQDGFFELDREFRCTYVNRKAARQGGREPEDYIGKSIWDLFPYALGTQFEAVYKEVMETRRSAHFEIKSPSLDQYYDISAYPSVRGISVFWRDVTEHMRAEEALRKARDELEVRVVERTAELQRSNSGLNAEIQERKRAEEALRESEGRLRLAQQVAHIGTFEWNIQTGVNTWTPELEAMYGLPRGGFPGTQPAWEQLVYPEDRAEAVRRTSEAIEKGELNGEWRVVWPDGSIHWLYGRGFVFKDNNGKPLKLIGINIDITERKLAEEELRYEASVQENMSEAVITTDAALIIRSWNKGAENIYGWKAEEVIGKPSREIAPTRYPGRARDEVYREFVEKGAITTELISRRKDGSEIALLASGTVLRDTSGKTTGTVTVTTDITERKRAEVELRKSEEKYRELVENANSIILSTDRDGNITFINEFAQQFFGYSEAEIIGRNALGAILPVKDSSGMDLSTMLDDLLQHPEEFRTNTNQNLRKNGKLVWVAWTNKAIYDDEGNLAGLFSVGNDITRLKCAEDALKEAKQQAELYMDLMGHDISNMNQIALGYLELAMGLPPGVQQDELLEKPIEVLQRSSQLIKNVRKLQTLSQGLNQTHEIDVGGVLLAVQRESGAVPGKRVTLNLNCHGHCYVQANELLHDVFANLVSNAIKHTGEQADIDINLDICDDNGRQYCRVTVEDDGPGIPDDYKVVIFNRVLKGTKKAKGMGLGLYLVKSLVDGYNGKVWVEDRVLGDHTKGARFVVLLPAFEK